MNMNGLPRKRIVASVLLTTLLVALAFMVEQTHGTAAIQTQRADDVVAAQAPAAPQSAPAALPDGATDTMKVHGSWTIVVIDPDGTVVERRDFENGFFGSEPMTSFLTRSTYVGFWAVFLDGNPQPCSSQSTPPVASKCIIRETAAGNTTGGVIFANLQVSSSAGTVRLAGSATIANTGSLSAVETWVGECPTATIVSTCGNVIFTAKVLAAPIAVQAGQQVQVTVVLSFS